MPTYSSALVAYSLPLRLPRKYTDAELQAVTEAGVSRLEMCDSGGARRPTLRGLRGLGHRGWGLQGASKPVWMWARLGGADSRGGGLQEAFGSCARLNARVFRSQKLQWHSENLELDWSPPFGSGSRGPISGRIKSVFCSQGIKELLFFLFSAVHLNAEGI